MRFVDMQMYNSVHSEYSGDLKYLHTWLVVSLCLVSDRLCAIVIYLSFLYGIHHLPLTETLVIIIIMYIYCALINVLSAHMIHINLSTIFYTHVEHSLTNSI